MKYTVIIEKTRTGYSAYLPDVPGCIATGRTEQAVRKNIAEALEFHFEGLRLAGQPIPRPKTQSAVITASMPALVHA